MNEYWYSKNDLVESDNIIVCIGEAHLPTVSSMDRIDPTTTSYIDFFCGYLLPNKPCIFTSNITEEWKSCKEWKKPDGSPNIEFLVSTFGDAIVPVVNMGRNIGYETQEQMRMKMRDFLLNHIDPQTSSGNGSLYLKDWHFMKDFPSYHAYQSPIYFQNDWMNEYWDSKNDSVENDYRFVYIGGKDTWTPFHADVFRSYSWSANICGRKRWLLVRPGVESEIRKRWEKCGKISGSMSDIRDVLQSNPELCTNNDVLDIIQNPGEIIFVPSNWHHQVHNLDSVISINHNWCNGANIGLVWRYLSERLDAVKKELSDCRSLIDKHEWYQQCQVVLKCDIGMDYNELLSMLYLIMKKRLDKLKSRVQNPKIDRSLYRCRTCVNTIVECEKTSNEIDHVKMHLKENCKCGSSFMSQCEACSDFFAFYDALTAEEIMKSVLATEDAAVLSNVFSAWNDLVGDVNVMRSLDV